MKQWITLIAASAIFSACTKQDLQDESIQANTSNKTSAMRSSQEGAYVSDWEQYSNWTKTDEGSTSMFTLARKTPELNSSVLNGGLLLSYAKVSTSDPSYAQFTSPKMMPFYFLPEAERPVGPTHYFSDITTEGNITISYRVPFTKQSYPAMGGGASLQGFRFQFVALTKAFLDSHGLTAEMVRNNYSYDQVMNLIHQ